MSKIKIFFVCSGLGVINRGYESFTRECFDTLKDDQRLEAYLYKGGGQNTIREKCLFNLPRFGSAAKFFSKITSVENYTIEQFTFCLSLIPSLIFKKPNLILVSDFILSTYLFHIRKFFNLKYKIIFSNGAPNGPPFNRCDHVQQLLPVYYQIAIEGNTSPNMMSIIPYGIDIKGQRVLSDTDKEKIREKLGIPTNAFVYLSVGAINDHHKRMSYLINEFSNFNKPTAYLVILGQMEEESTSIIALAGEKLSANSYQIKSVPYAAIGDYYRCADAFILTSLNEGFGRVFLEALSYGLPVIAHEAPIFHQVLGKNGIYLDLAVKGALSNFIRNNGLVKASNDAEKFARITATDLQYGWQGLKENYIKMIEKTIAQL